MTQRAQYATVAGLTLLVASFCFPEPVARPLFLGALFCLGYAFAEGRKG